MSAIAGVGPFGSPPGRRGFSNPNNLVLSAIFGEEAVARTTRLRRRSSIDGGACASASASPSPFGTSPSQSNASRAEAEEQKLSLAIGILRVLMNERKVSADDVRRIARRLRGEFSFGHHSGVALSYGGIREGGGDGRNDEHPSKDEDKNSTDDEERLRDALAESRSSLEVPVDITVAVAAATSPGKSARSGGNAPQPSVARHVPISTPREKYAPLCSQSRPQQKKTPDPTVRYRSIALRFLYDGSAFSSGFAENVGLDSDDSVERALFAALRKTRLVVDRSTCRYSRAGRTDRGVSAWGQTVGLTVRSAFVPGCKLVDELEIDDGRDVSGKMGDDDLPRNSRTEVEVWVPPRQKKAKKQKKKKGKRESIDQPPFNGGAQEGEGTNAQLPTSDAPMVKRTLTEIDYPRLLNNVLPPSIRVLGWSPVTPAFSARFSCSSRTYRYYFVQRDLDLDKMREGLKKLVGRHDFRNMCKMNVEEVYNFERVVHTAEIVVPNVRSGGGGGGSMDVDVDCAAVSDAGEPPHFRRPCHFLIIGQAFLWHQIRCIVSVLFMIGRNLEPPSVIDELFDIESNPGKPAYEMAPELPLVLHSCDYLNVRMGYGVLNLWNVNCDLERKWEELQLAAERLRDGMARLGREAVVSREEVAKFVNDVKEERRRKGQRGNKRLSPERPAHPPPKRKSETQRVGNTSGDGIKETDNSGGDRGSDGIGYNDNGNLIPWAEALLIIRSSLSGLRPSPAGPKEALHAPLMSRSRGTTYEEKVAAILAAGGGRRQRYEENVIGKRKSTEEDEAFYGKMLREGGTGE